jgi:hypothetical protein
MSGDHAPSSRAATLFPGASHKQVGSGLHGLLWDPVTAMPAEARRQWSERAIPVAVTAFDGTSADFWLSHWSDAEVDRLSVLHVAVDDSGSPAGWVQAMARDAAEYLGQAADIDLATLRIDDAYHRRARGAAE